MLDVSKNGVATQDLRPGMIFVSEAWGTTLMIISISKTPLSGKADLLDERYDVTIIRSDAPGHVKLFTWPRMHRTYCPLNQGSTSITHWTRVR